MNIYKHAAIVRDLTDAAGSGITKRYRPIAKRRGVTVAEVREIHQQERKRKAKEHKLRRKFAMQGAVLN